MQLGTLYEIGDPPVYPPSVKAADANSRPSAGPGVAFAAHILGLAVRRPADCIISSAGRKRAGSAQPARRGRPRGQARERGTWLTVGVVEVVARDGDDVVRERGRVEHVGHDLADVARAEQAHVHLEFVLRWSVSQTSSDSMGKEMGGRGTLRTHVEDLQRVVDAFVSVRRERV